MILKKFLPKEVPLGTYKKLRQKCSYDKKGFLKVFCLFSLSFLVEKIKKRDRKDKEKCFWNKKWKQKKILFFCQTFFVSVLNFCFKYYFCFKCRAFFVRFQFLSVFKVFVKLNLYKSFVLVSIFCQDSEKNHFIR